MMIVPAKTRKIYDYEGDLFTILHLVRARNVYEYIKVLYPLI